MVKINQYQTQQQTEHELFIKAQGHVTEFNSERLPIDIYITTPTSGINTETDILVVCLGFANDPNSRFLRKFKKAIANKFNTIVISVGFLGYQVTNTRSLRLIFSNSPDIQKHIKVLKFNNELYQLYQSNDLDGFAKLARGQDLSSVLTLLESSNILSPNCYIDYGYIQAIDIIQSILITCHHFRLANPKVFAFGSSLGGYILHMATHFAPNLFTYLVDVSAQVVIDHNCFINGRLSRGILDTFNTSISIKRASFYAESGPYKLLDKHLAIRNLLARNINPQTSCKYLMFAGTTDIEAPLQHKIDYFKKLVSAGIDADLIAVTSQDLNDGIFSHTGHSLGCNFYKLLDSLFEGIKTTQTTNKTAPFETIINTPYAHYSVKYTSALDLNIKESSV